MGEASEKPVLVLGASGSVGGAIATELVARSRPLRVFARHPARVAARFGPDSAIEVIPGDVQDRAALIEAAEGCAAIVHGVNYPYHRWVPYSYTATLNVIAAAQAAGAFVLFPGNVYGLGAQSGGPLGENAPNRATTRKGRIRIRLEDTLRAATEPAPPPVAATSGKPSQEPPQPPPPPIQVLVLRAGDYFGPTARNGFVDRIFGRAAAGKPIQCFGALDVPHEWVYLRDLARAAVALIDMRGQFRPFEVVNFPGHVVDSEQTFFDLIGRAAGRPGLKVQRMPWSVLSLFGLFNPEVRELMELRYLFDTSVVLDGAKLRALLPDFRATALEDAVRETLESYRT